MIQQMTQKIYKNKSYFPNRSSIGKIIVFSYEKCHKKMDLNCEKLGVYSQSVQNIFQRQILIVSYFRSLESYKKIVITRNVFIITIDDFYKNSIYTVQCRVPNGTEKNDSCIIQKSFNKLINCFLFQLHFYGVSLSVFFFYLIFYLSSHL